jgi:hypothetical protein
LFIAGGKSDLKDFCYQVALGIYTFVANINNTIRYSAIILIYMRGA